MSVDTLLNFNGVNGSAVFTDDGLSPLTFSTVEGSPVLSTIEKKFGTASLSLNGSSSIKSTPFIYSGIWTMECWFYCTSTPALNIDQCIFNHSTTLINGLYLRGVSGGGFQLVYYNNNVINSNTQFGDLSLNTWYHLALVSNGTTCEIYLNSLIGFLTSSISRDIEIIEIGSFNSGNNNFTGFIDGFRFTKDEILYNVLSKTVGLPISELTTTTVQPPSLPTDHKLIILSNQKSNLLNISLTTSLDHIIIGGGGSSGTPVEPPATSTNIISGNVKKLGLPFGAKVVIVSTGVTPSVVGSGVSDDITGDYSIDIYPETEEVLIYVAPDYGGSFIPDAPVGIGQIIHPAVPNRYIFIAQNTGIVGSSEPAWVTTGTINSGAVTFLAVGLHRPLMNGFIKPVITPIP